MADPKFLKASQEVVDLMGPLVKAVDKLLDLYDAEDGEDGLDTEAKKALKRIGKILASGGSTSITALESVLELAGIAWGGGR